MKYYTRLPKTFAFGLIVAIATTFVTPCRAYVGPNRSAALSSPSVSFLRAKELGRVSGKVSVAIHSNDPSGISRVDLLCDGTPVGTIPVSPSIPDSIVYFAWDTASVANGKHNLQAKAFNSAGAQTSVSRPVFVRNFPIASPSGNVIALNPYVKYQVMRGWEATDQAGQLFSPAWNNYKDALFDSAVNDLGINRIRLEILSGIENPVDYFAQWRAGQITESQYNAKRYEIINDDADPNHINSAGFKFSQLDSSINNVVLPMKQRLAARGERLWVNLNYVDFGSSTFEHKSSPAEYAEFVLAAYQHMQSVFGFVPDTWEVVLEPDTSTANWSAGQVAAAIKAAGDKLVANGFTPSFTAPSVTSAANAPSYIDQISQTSGAMSYVSEFSYHRYTGASTSILQQISDRAILYDKRVGMLEWIGADYVALHQDIKQGRNSSWQQFCLAGPISWGPDSGDRYYIVDDTAPANPVITMGSKTRFLTQYFKFIREGSRRIQALSGNQNFDPVGFVNANGKYVVVVKAGSGGSFSIQGLPSGTYGITYTTANEYSVALPDASVTTGQSLSASIPAFGVVTIYGR
ncbi:MAG TPA: Ig-like domain-containing protein [Pyrinomonadaceae bacterium]|nr:Ig-like domain-containing protein [Pyrinomonadaceae bacterium]